VDAALEADRVAVVTAGPPARPLATARLRLRVPRTDDALFLVRLMNDPDWLRHIGDRHVHDAAAAAAYVERRMLPPFREHGFGMFVVEALATGAAAGICGLVKRASLDACDLGFAFLPEQRGRGYAVEAGAAVLADARGRLALSRVLAITAPENEASARVLERLGMTPAGEAPDGDRTLRVYAWQARGRQDAPALVP
jgi:[ribosomal protein S5]-alanine N-acetyltransferase